MEMSHNEFGDGVTCSPEITPNGQLLIAGFSVETITDRQNKAQYTYPADVVLEFFGEVRKGRIPVLIDDDATHTGSVVAFRRERTHPNIIQLVLDVPDDILNAKEIVCRPTLKSRSHGRTVTVDNERYQVLEVSAITAMVLTIKE